MYDALWVGCVSAVSKARPMLAAHLSVLLYLCQLVSTLLIINNNLAAIVAFVAGNWLGTYLAARRCM